jgi:hypothetical protein
MLSKQGGTAEMPFVPDETKGIVLKLQIESLRIVLWLRMEDINWLREKTQMRKLESKAITLERLNHAGRQSGRKMVCIGLRSIRIDRSPTS